MITRKKSQIVVITGAEDAHVPFVQRHLDWPLHCIDPQALLKGETLSHEVHKNSLTVVHAQTRLTNVTGVWYRKPQAVQAAQITNVAEGSRQYCASAIHMHVMQLLTAFEGATWVSDYFSMLRASNKSRQLHMAASLGFRTPATLITSDPAEAQHFIEQQKQVLVKPLSVEPPVVDGSPQMFFASLIDKKALPSLQNLHLAPVILQQAIDAAYDIRVTVVGEKVFAAAIHNEQQSMPSFVRDWRVGQFDNTMQVEPFLLPTRVREQCVQLVKNLGLRFGAMDLVKDKRGRLWFIENNANGQWAFIEERTGQPIGKAMAQLLTSTA